MDGFRNITETYIVARRISNLFKEFSHGSPINTNYGHVAEISEFPNT